mmetsp:Transcript_30913/g.64103  ORF Transcript_30913/g.64103 Transcript_30913/m.64103 type:complete len:286 (+) Transcript_30913:2-859(+)
MQTLSIYGESILPAALCDAHGKVVTLAKRSEEELSAGGSGETALSPYVRESFSAAGESEGRTEPWGWKTNGPFASESKFVECELRDALMWDSDPYAAKERGEAPEAGGMGMVAGLAFRPFPASIFPQAAIPHSLSRARAIGDAILRAKESAGDVVAALQSVDAGAALLMAGKVVLVQSNSAGGFAAGSVEVRSEAGEKERVRVQFQNEYLRCTRVPAVAATRREDILAEVPDLVCILDAENGAPIATEEVKYGLRVLVVTLPAHPRLRTPQALEVVGPVGFKSLA